MNNKDKGYFNNRERQPKARQIIIERELEKARRAVIEADIEVGYYQRLIDGKIFGTVEPYVANMIKSNLELTKENYRFALERLNYLKELRDAEKDKQAIKAAEKAPATVQVQLKSSN